MSSVYYLFYAIAILIILGVGVLVYRWAGRRNRSLGVLAGLLSSATMVLIWPIPIHGGFTFLGSVLFDELHNEWQRLEKKQAERKDQRFMLGLEARFAGVIDVSRIDELTGSWSEVTLVTGEVAWLERHSGLVWSAPLSLATNMPLAAIEDGKNLCRELAPIGSWALPTEAERYQFWRAAGREHLPHKVAPAMGYIVNEDMGMELPSVSLPAKKSGNISALEKSEIQGVTQLMLRCVARTPDAPARGYIRSDIPLSEWNRYQLAKVAGR